MLAGAGGGELLGLKNDDGSRWSVGKETAAPYARTEEPVGLDCWNHVQISLHAANGSYAYQIVLQPVGELPIVLASGTLPAERAVRLSQFLIQTDNLKTTSIRSIRGPGSRG